MFKIKFLQMALNTCKMLCNCIKIVFFPKKKKKNYKKSPSGRGFAPRPPFVIRLTEVESKTQGSRPRPRPRTQKKSEAKAKHSPFEDRHSRGQGQECSRPWPRIKGTNASVLEKKVFTKIFQAVSSKKRFPKNFSGAPQTFNNSKSSLSSSRGQGNF